MSKSVDGIKYAADGASDKLRDLAGMIDLSGKASKKAASEAEKQAKAYDKVVLSAQQHIAASQLEASTIGMTTEQINAQKYAQDLLNKAANDNIKLTPTQTAQLTALGYAMAAAEAATDRLRQTYEFGKDTFGGFFSDLKQNLAEGQGLWGSFANAATNAIDKILDKAMDAATDSAFNWLWNAALGALGGGVGAGGKLGTGLTGANVYGGVGGYYPGLTGPSLASFDGGGFTGYGSRSGGLDGRGGFPALLHPNETVVDHTKTANQNQSNDNRPNVSIVNQINGSGLSQEQLAAALTAANQQTLDSINAKFPDAVQDVQRNKHARGKRYF